LEEVIGVEQPITDDGRLLMVIIVIIVIIIYLQVNDKTL